MLQELNYEQIQKKRVKIKKFYELWAPDGTGKSIWDILGFLCILYQAIVVPYRISFEQPPKGAYIYIEGVQDFYFITDILVNFNSGVYIQGVLVMSRIKSTLFYLRTWFLLDLIASFPYDYVFEPNGDEQEGSSNYQLI